MESATQTWEMEPWMKWWASCQDGCHHTKALADPGACTSEACLHFAGASAWRWDLHGRRTLQRGRVPLKADIRVCVSEQCFEHGGRYQSRLQNTVQVTAGSLVPRLPSIELQCRRQSHFARGTSRSPTVLSGGHGRKRKLALASDRDAPKERGCDYGR